MGSFGERLRREREMRGISLEEISAATKIGTRSLRALEDEDFSKLPGGIFNKGFVRAYARFLGIDEEQMVADYITAVGQTEPNSRQVVQTIAAENERRIEQQRREEAEQTRQSPQMNWMILAVVILAVAAVASGWRTIQKRHAARRAEEMATTPAPAVTTPPPALTSAPASVPTPETAPSQPVPAQSAAAPAAAPATAAVEPAPAGGFSIGIRATADCWVGAHADGKSVLNATLTSGQEKTLSANDRLVLVLGQPRNVELTFNGKALGPVGQPGKRYQATFTAAGLQ